MVCMGAQYEKFDKAKYEKLAIAVRVWLREHDEDVMIRSFDTTLARRFGVQHLKAFVGWNRHGHTIVHELAKKDKRRVVVHLARNYGWDLNCQRASDGCTPLHLAVWHCHGDMFGTLLQLGADPSIKNDHGEYPERLFDPKLQTYRARILGTRDTEGLLCIVQQALGQFDGTDTVTAYYQLANLTCYFDAKVGRWQSRGRSDTEEFRPLREACRQTLSHVETSDAGSHWELMLRCLLMLPDAQIMQRMLEVATSSALPLQSWDVNTLGGIVWGIAKLSDGKSLWHACEERLGNEIAERIDLLDELYLGLVCWAFGKADGRHPALFAAVARRLEAGGAKLQSPGSVSRIAWGFAKAGEQHPWAFKQLALSCLRLHSDFEDHDGSLTLWAYARLGFKHDELFRVLWRRLGATLYRNAGGHVAAKACTWSQVYYVYMFCREACPAVLSSLSPRLASDLHKISTGCHHDGLSVGSGVETEASLREMDELIAEMAAHAPMESVGVDSLEGDPRNFQQEVAATSVSQAAGPAEGSRAPSDRVIMLKFARSPARFWDTLTSARELEPCRCALAGAGLRMALPSGAKAFVHPDQHGPLLDALRDSEVTTYSSDVLVSEDLERNVMDAMARLADAEGAAPWRGGGVALSWEEIGAALSFRVQRTLVRLQLPPRRRSADGSHLGWSS